MGLIIYIVLILFIIFVCVISIPLISMFITNIKSKEETFYLFTEELIDSEYPDTKFFSSMQEEINKRKQQIYSKELP